MASIPPPSFAVPQPPAAPRRNKVPWWVWLIVAVVCGGTSVLLSAWVLAPLVATKSDAQLRREFTRLKIPAKLAEVDAHIKGGHDLRELDAVWDQNKPKLLGESVSVDDRRGAETRLLNTMRELAERHDAADFGAFAALDPGEISDPMFDLQVDVPRLIERGVTTITEGDRAAGRRDVLAGVEWMTWLHQSHYPGAHIALAESLERSINSLIHVLDARLLIGADRTRLEALLSRLERPLNWLAAVEAEPVVTLEVLYSSDSESTERSLSRGVVTTKLGRITRVRDYVKSKPNDLLGLADELRKVPAGSMVTGGITGGLAELISNQTQDLVEAEPRRQALLAVLRAGLYMEAERTRTGQFPTSLPADFLVDDPFRPGQALQYRFDSANEAFVWSVGPDRTDNQGRSFWDLPEAEQDAARDPFDRKPDPGDYVY